MSETILIDFQAHYVCRCPTCKTKHSVSPELYQSAINSRNGSSRIGVYCPYGHQWWFTPQKEIDEQDQIRRERDRLKQQIAYKDDLIDEERRSKAAYKGQVTRLKNRAAAGVCPCCSRHFSNLENHIATKHPEMKKETA